MTAGGKESAGHARYLSGNVELTFLGHPFEGLGRVFDTILAVVAVGREQPDHLIGAAGGRTRDIAGSKIDSLSNGEFVLQRPLHHARTSAVLTVPLLPPTEKPCDYIAQRPFRWPVHQDMANVRILQVFQCDKRNFGGSGPNGAADARNP